MKSVQLGRMLPRFDSQATEWEKISQSNSIYRYHSSSYEKILLLPRFQSDHRIYYDENQSAETVLKTISETKINLNEMPASNHRSNKFDIKFLERAYDRSGKKCWPAVNTKIGKFDLEYTYEIVGSTLESYIRYRKLNGCKALSNFIEYRNKVYKREKIAQYALPEPKAQMKEIHFKQLINIPMKIIHIEENQTPSDSLSLLTTSETGPPTPILSSQSVISQTSEKLSPSTPVPSPKFVSPKTSQKLSPPTPVPSSKSLTSKTSGNLSPSTPIPSSKSLTSKTSQKLSPSTTISSSRSMIPKTSQKLSPSTPIPSAKSISSKTSQKLSPSNTKEAIIPIPSADLLRSPTPKQSKLNVPKKTTKQTSSPSVKGASPPKSKLPLKTKSLPKKTLSKSPNRKQKKTACNIL